tara:strand:- start:289 stop:843 length:555 start_codon:yes stop_codon:yes gene_type:complete
MLEMTIDSIRVSLMNYQRVVILKQKELDRYLPIWIGPAEADAIAVRLQDIEVPRPLTHDLLQVIIDNLGAVITHIMVSDLKDDTFFAKIGLVIEDKTLEIDARPSDAIALAVRAEVPIYAEDSVLETAGIQLDAETGKPILPEDQAENLEKTGKVRDDELQKLSAFTDFIDTLDLEDFGATKNG